MYDSNTGTLLASVYDSNMETFENYALNSSGRDGAAVMMALFPMLMQDDEFKENFEAYQDELNAAIPIWIRLRNTWRYVRQCLSPYQG